jgi:hypothetical protein
MSGRHRAKKGDIINLNLFATQNYAYWRKAEPEDLGWCHSNVGREWRLAAPETDSEPPLRPSIF